MPQARRWAEATTTSTGNQDNFNFSNADLLRCNNNSLLTLRGLSAGVAGQRLTIVSVGGGQVDLSNENTNSTAANRIANGLNGTVSLSAGVGRVDLQYDGTTQRWRVISHDQGAMITPVFSAGDYTGNGSMTWTVDSGDVQTCSYILRGRILTMHVAILTSTVGGTLNTSLRRAIPGGYVANEVINVPCRVLDAGTWLTGVAAVGTGGTVLAFLRDLTGATNWSAATNNTLVVAAISFKVQ